MPNTISAQTRKKINLVPGMMEKVSEHDADIYRLKKTMFGNGEPGWDEQIRNIQLWIQLQIDKEKRQKEFWDKFAWLIISTGVVGVIAFISQFIVFWVKIVPSLVK